MTGLGLAAVVAVAVAAGTLIVAIVGVLIDREARRDERTEGR